jgi:hypothetical protein
VTAASVRLTVKFVGGGGMTADVPTSQAQQVLGTLRGDPDSGTIKVTSNRRTTLIRTAAVACVNLDEIPDAAEHE